MPRLSWGFVGKSFVALNVLAAGAVTAILLAGPESVPALANVQYLPYLAFLVPAVLAFCVGLALGWRWAVAAAACCALVVLVFMDLTWGSEAEGSHRVRVMTYNVKDYETLRFADGAQRIADEVERFDPDVAVMQDAWDIADLAREGKIFKGRQSYDHDELLVVSRHRILGCVNDVLGTGVKKLLHVRCRITNGDWTFDVHAVHLISPRRGLNALRTRVWGGLDAWDDNVEARMEQARALADFAASAPRPAVIAGDFNAPPRSLVLHEMATAGFGDAFAAAGRGFGFTYGHQLLPGLSFLRLDHVLVDSSIGVVDCFVAPAGISPHRAVIADLVLRKSP